MPPKQRTAAKSGLKAGQKAAVKVKIEKKPKIEAKVKIEPGLQESLEERKEWNKKIDGLKKQIKLNEIEAKENPKPPKHADPEKLKKIVDLTKVCDRLEQERDDERLGFEKRMLTRDPKISQLKKCLALNKKAIADCIAAGAEREKPMEEVENKKARIQQMMDDLMDAEEEVIECLALVHYIYKLENFSLNETELEMNEVHDVADSEGEGETEEEVDDDSQAEGEVEEDVDGGEAETDIDDGEMEDDMDEGYVEDTKSLVKAEKKPKKEVLVKQENKPSVVKVKTEIVKDEKKDVKVKIEKKEVNVKKKKEVIKKTRKGKATVVKKEKEVVKRCEVVVSSDESLPEAEVGAETSETLEAMESARKPIRGAKRERRPETEDEDDVKVVNNRLRDNIARQVKKEKIG